MFGVDWGMSLRQSTAGSPWAGGAWILEARWIRMEEQIGPLPRRDFGANQLKTISRPTPSKAFLRNALDPVLSAPVCLTRNTNGARAKPTRPPRARVSLERTAQRVGRQQGPAQSQLGDRDSRPDAAGHIEEASTFARNSPGRALPGGLAWCAVGLLFRRSMFSRGAGGGGADQVWPGRPIGKRQGPGSRAPPPAP